MARPKALTDEQAEQIRTLWNSKDLVGAMEKKLTMKELAALYNVHYMTIFNVIHERGPYGPKVIPVVEPAAKFREYTFYADQSAEVKSNEST